MATSIPQNASVYTELSSLQALKGKVKSGDADAIKNVAQQFEAIFLQMMLSGMRKTIQVSDEYSNDKSMYYDLFDKQVAMNMSEKGGIGLARIMMQQGGIGGTVATEIGPGATVSANNNREFSNILNNNTLVNKIDSTIGKQAVSTSDDASLLDFDSPMQFIKTIWNVAKDVIQESGLDPKAVLAQAALETGWGQHIMKSVTGESSFNLFGIKSGRQWQGEQALANTLEYKDGVMTKSREGFRAYGSIKQSVQDYVDFLNSNQRYSEALNQAHDADAYVVELQKAGYATDPDYANKIQSIMRRPEFSQLFDNAIMQDI